MKYSYRVLRLFGISVELHITFIFFLLLISLLGFVNVIFWLTIFVIVLMHELIHSLVAMGFGIDVPKITLTPIGGLASIDVPEDPKKELLISIAGPMSNFVLAAVVYVVLSMASYDLVSYGTILQEFVLDPAILLSWMIWINLLLGVFNIIPAFPMDGGRVFRSVLALWMDHLSATKIAVKIGQFLAMLMVIVGFFINFWLVIIGLFLYYAGGSEFKVVGVKHGLRGLRVGDIAVKNMLSVSEDQSVADFIASTARERQQYYPVTGPEGRVTGVVDLKDIQKVDKKDFAATPLRNIAGSRFQVIDADIMAEKVINRLLASEFILVKESDRVIGYLTPERLFKAAQFHSLLK